MTREDLKRQYAVNRRGVIVTPGKFVGQMLYVPYFWDKYQNGLADDTTGDIITFFITDGDRQEFPELRQASVITLLDIEHTLVCELPGRLTDVEFKRKPRGLPPSLFRLFKKKSALTEDVSADGQVR
jgi:hypothetical protein